MTYNHIIVKDEFAKYVSNVLEHQVYMIFALCR